MNMGFFQFMQRISRLFTARKTIFYISCLVFLMILIPGCISPVEFTEDAFVTSRSSSETSDRFPDYEYNPETLRYASGPRAAVKEDGYYLEINSALYFYDIQTEMLFPLCTKASCLHKDETCPAFIFNAGWRSDDEERVKIWTDTAYGHRIWYYQEHLYMIAQDPDKGMVLFRYDPDYTGQEEIAWLTDYEKEPRTMFTGRMLFHHGYIYYMTHLFDDQAVWYADEYETVYTVWRVKPEKKAKPEELFSFDCHYRGSQIFRIGAVQNKIYVMIEYETFSIIPENERKEGENPINVNAGFGRVYQYDEDRNQAELIWSYSGEQMVSLFEAEGAMPRNTHSDDYLVNAEGDYVYLSGMPEHFEEGLMPTGIASVNLITGEGKVLYKTPYKKIEQLRSDGRHYYFLEIGAGGTYLTAIDQEGNLLRRYEMPYDEAYIRMMEEKSKLPREEWANDRLRLLVTDGRYIVLGDDGARIYKNLSSKLNYDGRKYSHVDNGVGLIDAEDFLSGKDVEIRQIYERMDPFD